MSAKYDPDASCPKCGHDDVGTTYYSGPHYPCRDGVFAAEHLDRTCRRCQYKWVEECITGDEP